MANFKLDRYRYSWKGDWQSGTDYSIDDIVRVGGRSYVCTITHTSSSVFATDQETTPKWAVMTVSKTFTGEWSDGTDYNYNDIVLYQGSLHECITPHTASSFLENDKWQTFALGSGFQSEWQENTTYGIGAVVKYGGIVYQCIESHYSANFDTETEKWRVFYKNLDYKGAWIPNTYYKQNELVKYGPSIFKCVSNHQSSIDNFLFILEIPGFQFENTYNSSAEYNIGDIVRYGGNLYYAITNNVDRQPNLNIDSTQDWILFVNGYNFRGIWNKNYATSFKAGDVIQRGGYLYQAVTDVNLADGELSSNDMYNSSVWELLVPGTMYIGNWKINQTYTLGELLLYRGSLYKCNTEHTSNLENFPGDNGNVYNYWDVIIPAGSEAGLNNRGDLLTYGLYRQELNDNSTFGPTNITIGNKYDILTIDSNTELFWKNFDLEANVIYVGTNGKDADFYGKTFHKPFRTIAYACQYVEDNITPGTPVKISVATGRYEETGPIVVPVGCVVMGDELRSVTVVASKAKPSYTNNYVITLLAGMQSITLFLYDLLVGNTVVIQPGNTTPFVKLTNNATRALDFSNDMYNLILVFNSYVNNRVFSSGNLPPISGSNNLNLNNGKLVNDFKLNLNFITDNIAYYIINTNTEQDYDINQLKFDIKEILRGILRDLTYSGNYLTCFMARRFVNNVFGTVIENQGSDDLFYVRDTTGIRSMTLEGLSGKLNPSGVYISYQRPTGGSYVSLDPGWGPADNRTWITNRSPYIQGVTNIGTACYGKKIDGALHNGGNRSMVSNDFTQVLSDGVGVHVVNNARTELVSVFTYYCQVGYFAENGGIIRATNGNNSYGSFGSIAQGVDLLEVPANVTVNNKKNQAIVESALAGGTADNIILFEYANAGENYTTANAEITGAGVDARVEFTDFRDNALSEGLVRDNLPSGVPISTIVSVGRYTTIETTIPHGFTAEDPIYISGVESLVDDALELLNTDTSSSPGNHNIISIPSPTRIEIGVDTTGADTTQYVAGTGTVGFPGGFNSGYNVRQNGAQESVGLTQLGQLYLNVNEKETFPDEFIGKRIIIIQGTGVGQYGYIYSLDALNNNIVEVYKDSTNTLGWDHVLPGTTLVMPNSSSVYRIEPRLSVAHPGFSYTTTDSVNARTFISGDYGYGTGIYENITLDNGGGTVDEELTADGAVVNVDRVGKTYSVTLVNGGLGYKVGDILTIPGSLVGGTDSVNDITINVTGTTEDSSNSITNFTFTGTPKGKILVALASPNFIHYSNDGITWVETFTDVRNYVKLIAGFNKFILLETNSDTARMSYDGETWQEVNLPSAEPWIDIAVSKQYNGNNLFIAISENSAAAAYSYNGIDWVASSLPTGDDSAGDQWQKIAYGQGRFIVISASFTRDVAYTDLNGNNGIVWNQYNSALPDDNFDWAGFEYGANRFLALAKDGKCIFSIDKGESWIVGTSLPNSSVYTDLKYGQGVFVAVNGTNTVYTTEDGIVWKENTVMNGNITTLLFHNVDNKPEWIAFRNLASSDAIVHISTGAQAVLRGTVNSSAIEKVLISNPGSGYNSRSLYIEAYDPAATSTVYIQARFGNKVLSQPDFIDRGVGYKRTTSSIIIDGDGNADIIPFDNTLTLDGIPLPVPGPGAQISLDTVPDDTTEDPNDLKIFIGVNGVDLGDDGSGNNTRTVRFTVSPAVKSKYNVTHGTTGKLRLRYSQCRVSGHDFLDIGTGNFIETNYPEIYAGGRYFLYSPENEVSEVSGGRVFYTSSDQDGNFRTGELFGVNQSTGIVTISAEFFDLDGLTELSLGGVRLGGSGTVINEFSTDGTFSADSNNIIPTQRAIADFIANRLSVGGTDLETNYLTAGTITMGGSDNEIITGTINFRRVIDISGRDAIGNPVGVQGMYISQLMMLRQFEEIMQ